MVENIEAEKRIIRAMVGGSEAPEHLTKDHFSQFETRALYGLLMDLTKSGHTVGPVALKEAIIGQPQASQGHLNRCFEECQAVETDGALQDDVKRVIEASIRRTLFRTAETLAEEAESGSGDIKDVIRNTTDILYSVTLPHESKDIVTAGEVSDRVVGALKERMQHPGEIKGHATQFKQFNNMTNGLHPGSLFVLAGRPSMGKTALALNIAANSAVVDKRNVLVFSLEMTNDELSERLLYAGAKVDGAKAGRGELTSKEFDRVLEYNDVLQDNVNLFYDDTGGITLGEMRAKAKKVSNQVDGLDLIVVDYIQLMGGDGGDSREQEVSLFSRGLKALAKELSCCVIALSQLNRKVEERANKRPMMNDLRESGAIEQDADIVGMLYRDDYYNENSKEPGEAELNLVKHRNGPTGTVKLAFINEQARFEEIY